MSKGIPVVYIFTVHEDLVHLYVGNQYIVHGVFFGQDATLWTADELVHMRKGFSKELEHSLESKEPVFLKVFIFVDID